MNSVLRAIQPLPEKLHISSLVREAWRKITGHKKTFFLSLLIYLALMLPLFILEKVTHHPMVFTIFRTLFVMLLNAGILFMGLCVAFERPIHVTSIFQAFRPKIALKLSIARIIIFLILGALWLLALIAHKYDHQVMSITLLTLGILVLSFFFVRCSLYMSIIMAQKNASLPQAVLTSFKVTRHNFWRLVLLFLIEALALIASIGSFGVGFIWTFPFTSILNGLVYQRLVGHIFDPDGSQTTQMP